MSSSKAATAKIILSSVAPNGARLDTVQCRYWRAVHSETLTHRVFSRSAGSSRAVPVASILERDEVFVPRFKKNKAGMQPAAYLSESEQIEAEAIWREAADACRMAAKKLSDKHGLNVAKQWANRPLEWFGWIDVLITSTEWSNFDALRIHDEAQDEMRLLAEAIQQAREGAVPQRLKGTQWHLPYITDVDVDAAKKMVRDRSIPEIGHKVLSSLNTPLLCTVSDAEKLTLAGSAARACRVSFSKHDGAPTDFESDMTRFLRLAFSRPIHASPLEHQGRGLLPLDPVFLQGNFKGFAQFRKFIPGEAL